MTCLKTPEQAAAFLQCSPKQVHAHAKSGELRYVDIGRGSKRPCRRFTDADLIDFAERRSRREQPCQSTSPNSRRTTTTPSMRGHRFYGSTGTGDRRKAEAIERAARERAGAVRRSIADIPHTFGEAATRFWHEAGQHDATNDDTLRNLLWLGNAMGEHTPLADVDGNLLHRIVARRRGERAKNAGVQDFRFHDFRHDFATKLLRETGNLKIVQRALNHAEIQSTARYAHVGACFFLFSLLREQGVGSSNLPTPTRFLANAFEPAACRGRQFQD